MSLTKEDLKAIEQIVERTVDKSLRPIKDDIKSMKEHLISIDSRLDKLEQWIPVDNTFILKRISEKDTKTRSAAR